MKVLTLSHFDYLKGPQIFLKVPKSFDDEILEQIPSLMNLYDKGFFMHMVGGLKSANFIFEIPSEYMRGGHELLLISILITEGNIDINFSQELLKRLVDEFIKMDAAYKAFYVNSKDYKGDTEKLNTLENLFYTFFESFPEENIILKQREAKIFVFGLSNAGKTTIIKSLEKSVSRNTIPTTNVEISRILVNNLSLLTYDAPGQSKFRDLWIPHLNNINGLVFILDVCNKENFGEAKDILHKIALMSKIRKMPILILFNKIDLEFPDVESLKEELKLKELGDRPLKHFLTSGVTNENINEAFNWLALKLSESVKSSSEIDLGIIFSRWDEETGIKVMDIFPRDAFDDPEVIAIRCFSISQFVFGGKGFKKVSFILPFTHLKAKAAIYFDYVIDENVRGGTLPFSLVVFYREEIPSAIIDSFSNIVFETLDQIKEYYLEKVRVLNDLEELHKSLLILLNTVKPTVQVLRGEESRYRALFKAAGDAILIIDHSSGIILDANEQTKILFNRQLENIIGLHVSQLQLTEEFEKFKLQLLKQRDLTGVQPIMAWIKKTDENNIPVEVNVSEAHMGGKILLHCIFRDITERMEAENKLKEAELRYRTIFEQSPDGVMILDYETLRAIGFNDVMCTMLGYTQTEFSKLRISDYDASENPQETKTRVDKILKVGRDDFETKFRTKYGDIKDIFVTVKLIELSGGSYFHSICRDITQQKLIEKQIYDLAKFPSENPNPVLRVDKHKIIYANKTGKDLFKIKEESKVPKIIHNVVLESLTDNSIKEIEVAKNGQIYSFTCTPIIEEGYVNIYGRDITKHRESEKKLKESEELFRATFENASDAIFWADAETGLLINCNKTAEVILEKKRDEILGQHFDSIHLSEEKKLPIKDFKKGVSGLELDDNELTLITKTGKGIPTLFTLSKIAIGGESIIQGIFKDITDRKKTENELMKSQMKFSNLFHLSNDAIFLHDLNGKIFDVNQKALEMFGYSRSELLLSQKIEDLFFNTEKSILKETYKKISEKGVARTEITARKMNGDGFLAEVSSNLINVEGELLIQSIARDITDRKLAEQKLRDSEHELGERVKELNCLYGISRIVENPDVSINEIIQGTLELIPPAWQFPEVTCARVIYNKQQYKTGNFNETKWKLSSQLEINKKPLTIEVYYLEDKPFLKEEVNLINDIGKRLGIILEQMETQQKLEESEEKVNILNKSYLKFSDDPLANIQILVETVGSLLNADNALYNRIIEENGKEILKTIAIYKEPPSYERENDPLGHICTDVIRQNKDELVIIKDLNKTKYGKSDPGVIEFNLKQYCGISILLDKNPVGSFCLVYTKNRELSESDKNIIKLMSRSVTIEEQRWSAQKRLQKSEKSLLNSQKELSIRDQISNIFLTSTDDEIYSDVLSVVLDSSESKLGYFGYINENGDLVCPSLTRDVWDKCKIPDKNIIFPRDSWGGIWGESLEQKKIIISEGNFNLPKGHVSLNNILCVPIIHHEKLIGQIIVGNSPNGYGLNERALLERITQFISPILYLRLEQQRHDREQKVFEDKLQQSEEKYRRLFKESPFFIILLDLQGRIYDINPTIEKVIGFKKQEVFNQDFTQLSLLPIEFMPAVTENFKSILKGKNPKPQDIQFLTRSGELRWGNFQASLLRLKDKPLIQIIGQDITNRKQNEQEIIKSRELYQELYENAPIAYISVTTDKKIKNCNSSTAKLLGYSKEELLNMNYFDLYADIPYVTKKAKEVFQRFLNGESIHNEELQFKHKDGRIIWVNLSIKPIRNNNGEIIETYTVAFDITEQKQVEQMLKESEEKFRNITDLSLIGFCILQDNVVKYANKQIAEMYGYTVEEMQNWEPGKFINVIHPDDRELILDQATKKQEGKSGVTVNYQFRGIKKSGEVVWVDNHSKSIIYEGKPADLIANLDITNKKEAEQKWKASKQRFKTFFNYASDAIFIINHKGRFLEVNKTACDRLGYTKEEFLKMTPDQILSPDAITDSLKGIKETIEGGHIFVETIHLTKDGRSIPTEIHTRNIDFNGRPAIIGLARDITERKQADKELRALLDSTRKILKHNDFEEIARDIFDSSKDLIGAKIGYIALLTHNNKKYEKLFVDLEEQGCHVAPGRLMSIERFQTILSQSDNAIYFNNFSENKSFKILPKGHIKVNNLMLVPLIIKEKIIGILTLGNKETDFNEKDKKIAIAFAELASIALNNSLMLETLKESQNQFREALNRSEFYKDLVTHDINKILDNISSGTELINLYKNLPEKEGEMDEILQIISGQISRGVKLAENVRKLTTIEDSETVLQQVDLLGILNRSIKFVRESFQYRHINIQVDSKSEKFQIQANEFLSDVFENILLNAVKYNDNPIVKVMINISEAEEEGQNFIKIEFKDNGIGISNTRKKMIFERRSIVDENVRGLGIGLSLVKRIIESYLGKIWVEDNVGKKGSNFIILIPNL